MLKNKEGGLLGGQSPRPNYGKVKQESLKNRAGGSIDYEFLDKVFSNFLV